MAERSGWADIALNLCETPDEFMGVTEIGNTTFHHDDEWGLDLPHWGAGAWGGPMIWKKRGDQLLVSQLEDGTTILESDEPVQVINYPGEPTIVERLEAEARKHIPEGWEVTAGREEACAGYVVNVWPPANGRGVMTAPHDCVCRCRIGYEDVVPRPYQPHPLDWRLVLIQGLQRDFDERRANAGADPGSDEQGPGADD